MMPDTTDWNSLPTLDEHVIGPLCEVLEESAFEVIDEFLSDTPRLAAETRTALNSGDYPGVAGLAHQLKSSSGALGGAKVQKLAALVENSALAADQQQTPVLCSQLLKAIDELLPALRGYRTQLRA